MGPHLKKSLVKAGVAPGVVTLCVQSVSAQLLITQYYEGLSFNQ
jgi:hypothetical protein